MKSEFIFILAMLMAACIIAPAAAADNGTSVADDIEVYFNDTVYYKDLGNINVEIPENTSGNLKATVNDVEFYSENVSSSVSIPITIPQKAVSHFVSNRDADHITYYIDLFFNSTPIKSNHTLKVMRLPSDYSIQGFRDEILKDDSDSHVSLYFPESADGEIKIYIDGQFSYNLTANHYTFLDITRFNTLEMGNHNVTVIYSGDAYYRKFAKTFNFTVTDMLISIPKNMILDHDDCITAKTLKNRDGTVTVSVDGKAILKDKLDKNGEFLHSMFDDIICGEHIVEFSYVAGNFNKSKKVNVNVSCDVDIFLYGPFAYGSDNELTVTVPHDFKRNLISIKIDGRSFDFKMDSSGWVDVNVSGLGAGNHTVVFDYAGDGKYGSHHLCENFTVDYVIRIPFIFDLDGGVSLTLPKDAKGNLEVYVDDMLYASEKLQKGKVSVSVDALPPAKYSLRAHYTGDDYNVSDDEEFITVFPKITYPYEMYEGDERYITVTAVNGTEGKVIFEIAGKNRTVDIKDGKAELSLKNLKKGSYEDINVTYIGNNGFNQTLYASVDILAPKMKLTDLKVTGCEVRFKVNINGKALKNANVIFKIDKKAKKVKTDKKGFVTLRFDPGKHTLVAEYKNAKASKTFKIASLTLNSVSVKKSAKKVVLTAKLVKKLKNKVIKFRFNGKTVKAKTNSKGIAKVTFKTSKLKTGKKITYSATFKKDTVKKTGTVKK